MAARLHWTYSVSSVWKSSSATESTRPTTTAIEPETIPTTRGRAGTRCLDRMAIVIATTPNNAPSGGAKNALPTAAIETTASRMAVRLASGEARVG